MSLSVESEVEQRHARRSRLNDDDNNNNNTLWSCTRCTFINKATKVLCEMCNAPNSNESSRDERSTSESDVTAAADSSRRPDDSKWNCSRCTLENEGTSVVCEACGASQADASNTDKSNRKRSRDDESSTTALAAACSRRDEKKWNCSRCTLENNVTSIACKVCGASRPGASNRSHVGTAESSFAMPQQQQVFGGLGLSGATSTNANAASLNNSNARTNRATISTISNRVGFDGRIRWDPQQESIEQWVEAVKPSQISKRTCAWIQVDNINRDSPGYYRYQGQGTFHKQPYLKALAPLKEAVQSKRRINAAEKKACEESLAAIAKNQGETVGKWLVYMHNKSRVDELWSKIAIATCKGQLGCSAKINPVICEDRCTVCCVYVNDFSCRAEVKRVLDKLNEMEIPLNAGFKPDFYSKVGIYGNNEWKLQSTIYKVKEVLEQWK